MPTIVGILTFISRINYRIWWSKPEFSIYLGYFDIYEKFKFMLSWVEHERSFITSGQGLTQTRLYCHRSKLEAWNLWFRKKRNCTISVAKTKALISITVTAQLICAFVFAKAKILTWLKWSTVKSDRIGGDTQIYWFVIQPHFITNKLYPNNWFIYLVGCKQLWKFSFIFIRI